MKRVVGFRMGSLDPSEPTGGQEGPYQMYSQLAREFDVHVIACKSIVRRMRTATLAKDFRETVLPLFSLLSVYAIDKFLGTKDILLPPWFYSADIALSSSRKKVLKKLLEEADIIMLESWLLLPLVMKYRRADCRLMYRVNNIDAIFFEPMVPRWYWNFKKGKVERLERETLAKCDGLVTVAEEDRRILMQRYSLDGDRIFVFPIGANTTEFEPDPSSRDAIRGKYAPDGETICAFVGSNIAHNNEIAHYIACELAPKLPKCVFLILGRCAEGLRGRSLPSNVQAVGFLSRTDFKAVLSAVDIALNPVTYGSGMNIKMLTYMTAGIPTVTTLFGARGLDVEDGKHVVIADIDAFAQKIEQLAGDGRSRKRISIEARELALRKYDLNVIGEEMRRSCRKVLEGPSIH